MSFPHFRALREIPTLPADLVDDIIDINNEWNLRNFSRFSCKEQTVQLARWKTQRQPMGTKNLWEKLISINKETCLYEIFKVVHTDDTLKAALKSIFESSYEYGMYGVQNLKQLSLTITPELSEYDDPMQLVPDELFRLVNLQELSIKMLHHPNIFYDSFYGGTDGETLSIFFKKVSRNLPELTKLTIKRIFSCDISYEIGLLTKLDTLVLDDCKIDRLPGSIGLLTDLEKLSLSKNTLANLDLVLLFTHMQRCTKLRFLDLSWNDLPEARVCPGKEDNYDLGIANPMTIPGGLQSFTSLVTLVLHNTDMSHWPDVVCRMPSLQKLDLSFNSLKDIPLDIEALVNLKNLNMKHNLLSTVPHTMEHLTKLEYLDISHNKFDKPYENIKYVLDPTVFRKLHFTY